jgi:uncharacterized tellurite resistance protein B-like protein
MLKSIRRLFQGLGPVGGQTRETAGREEDLRVAAAALIFEIVRADAEVKPEERTVMRTALQSTFDLPGPEAEELMARAERESRSAVSIYEFTRLVDEGFSADQKKRIVELLWLVAFADTEKHALEEHMIRKIAGLLHVPHPDFIDAKIRARTTMGGDPPPS